MRKSTKHIILFIFLDIVVGVIGFVADLLFSSLTRIR